MDASCAAERALVSALVLGQADPAELSGRLRVSDFADPAAGVIFEAAMQAGSRSMTDLPRLLAARGVLRPDGYPISGLMEWLPSVPVPAHPQAWAALVVAGSLGRLVEQSGVRLVQASETADRAGGVARVLAVAAAQRAAVHGACRRWRDLPGRWRASLPMRLTAASPGPADRPGRSSGWAGPAVEDLERELLAGLVAAPRQLDRLTWLQARDFSGSARGQLFDTVRQLHAADRPVDLITLAASPPPPPPPRPGPTQPHRPPAADGLTQLCGELQPRSSVPAWVPVLARQVLSAAVLREAEQTGQRLVWLASGRAGVSPGLPMLDRALAGLDTLADPAGRWQQSRETGVEPRVSTVRVRTQDRTRDAELGRLPTDPAVPDRQGSGLDRTG